MHTKLVTKQTVSPIQALVDQFLLYCENSRGMSLSTIKTRKTHLTQFAQYCKKNMIIDIQSLTPAFIDDYFSYYQSSHSLSTANTGRRILKVFLRWIIGYKETNTVKPEMIQLVRTPKTLPRALSLKDVHEVIMNAKHTQDALMTAILLESGIRISELVAIRLEDIEFDAIHIHGKGSIERVVYISDKLAVRIKAYSVEHSRYPYEYLIQNVYFGYGQHMSVGTARLRIQKLFKEQGIVMYPHQLRHTFAVNLLKNGCDIVTISKLLGHADVKTTMVYLNVSNSFLREQHKLYMKFA